MTKHEWSRNLASVRRSRTDHQTVNALDNSYEGICLDFFFSIQFVSNPFISLLGFKISHLYCPKAPSVPSLNPWPPHDPPSIEPVVAERNSVIVTSPFAQHRLAQKQVTMLPFPTYTSRVHRVCSSHTCLVRAPAFLSYWYLITLFPAHQRTSSLKDVEHLNPRPSAAHEKRRNPRLLLTGRNAVRHHQVQCHYGPAESQWLRKLLGLLSLPSFSV
jgi:hypothetical protein